MRGGMHRFGTGVAINFAYAQMQFNDLFVMASRVLSLLMSSATFVAKRTCRGSAVSSSDNPAGAWSNR